MQLLTESQTYTMYDEISVIKIFNAVDQNNIVVVLAILSFRTQEIETISIMNTELTPQFIANLMERNGLPSGNAKRTCRKIKEKVLKILKESFETKVPIDIQHIKLGWSDYKGDLAFRADSIYTLNKDVKSEYAGEFDIISGGAVEVFKKMLEDCVINNIALSAICSMAVAATVLAFAKMAWKIPFYNIVNHLAGTSSLGKSTVTELFTAFGSAPDGKGSMKLSFLSTINAILAKVGKIQGYPCSIDESSLKDNKIDMTEFIYALANGEGKARSMAAGLKVSEIDHFATVFLTNGEGGLKRKCKNKNEGLRVRIIEYKVDSWTRDSVEANYIKKVCRDNYGLVTPLIAKELLKNSEMWKERFQVWLDRVKERIQAEKIVLGIGDRLSDYVALYMVSAEIMSSVLNLNFDIDKIYGFFFEYIIVMSAEDANIGMRAHEVVGTYYATHPDLFCLDIEVWEPTIDDLSGSKNNKSFAFREGICGIVCESSSGRTVDGVKYNGYIIFYPKQLEKILEEHYFEDPEIAIKEMNKKRLLYAHDDKRANLKINLNGSPVKVYAVWIQTFQ